MGDDERREWSAMEVASVARDEFVRISERLADGAQASIYSLFLLQGDEKMGIQGFIPKTEERFDRIESDAKTDRQIYTNRDAEMAGRMDTMETRLVLIETNQHRMRKTLASMCVAAFKMDWSKVVALLTGIAGLWASPHFGNWFHSVKKFLVAFSAAWR